MKNLNNLKNATANILSKKSKFFPGLLTALITTSAFAAAPTADNYYHVVQGINSKFDRDYSSVNSQGKPDPGAIAIVETFLKAMNDLKMTQSGNYHSFNPQNTFDATCSVASPTCEEMKVVFQPSSASRQTTLFGQPQSFDLDIVVWSNTGSGFKRFFEGSYSAVAGTPGRGNFTVVSCNGCSTVGHSQIEWDATGAEYHLRSKMYDTKLSNSPDAYGGVIVDAKYNPSTGETKMAIAAKNVCSSAGAGDSLCSGGPNDHASGYSAMLHANSISGNVYVVGVQGSNSSVIKPSIDAMCLKADKTQDIAGTVCAANGINNFTGISAFAPNDAPVSFIISSQPWPFADITDDPSF